MALGQFDVYLIPKSGGAGGRRNREMFLDPKDWRQLRQALIVLLPSGHQESDYRVEARKKGAIVGRFSG